MLIITTNTTTFRFNADLLKKNVKKAFVSIFKCLSIMCAIIGVMVVIITAGASDNNTLTNIQIIQHTLQGGLLCGIGYGFKILKNALQ